MIVDSAMCETPAAGPNSCGRDRHLGPRQRQEIRKQERSVHGEEALGVELHAVERRIASARPAPAQAHDLVLGRPRVDLELVAQRRPVDDQRVVSRRGERIGERLEDAASVVVDLRGLPVHQHAVPHHAHAVNIGEASGDRDTRRGSESRRGSASMRSPQTPDSFGVHGPGDSSRCDGPSATASSTVILSFRTTCISIAGSSSPIR